MGEWGCEDDEDEHISRVEEMPTPSLPPHGQVLQTAGPLEEVGRELKKMMADRISGFSTCSMERRDREEYDFNKPLLENLLAEKKEEYDEMLVAQLFLSPGRHAGEGGDLDRICSSFADSSPSHRLVRTDLLGTHPSVIEIIADRIEQDRSSN